MAADQETFFDILRAIGFVLAVVIGGLFIAGFVDGWNDAERSREVPEEQAAPEPRQSD